MQSSDTYSSDKFKTDMIELLPRLRRYALTLAKNASDADDLTQDTCIQALAKYKQYDPSQPLDRWIFRMMHNLRISELRKQKVRQGTGLVAAEDAVELKTHENSDDVILAKQVGGEISNLPTSLSQPLLLVCAEGYSYKEASELLDLPIGTIMSRIHRARKLLSEKFNEPHSDNHHTLQKGDPS